MINLKRRKPLLLYDDAYVDDANHKVRFSLLLSENASDKQLANQSCRFVAESAYIDGETSFANANEQCAITEGYIKDPNTSISHEGIYKLLNNSSE